MTLATLMLVALFYLAVVLGQPQEPENPITVSQDQPLLAASPALNIQSERQISTLSETFPVPILAFMEGMGPTLQSGTSYDLAFENGFARLTELTYTTGQRPVLYADHHLSGAGLKPAEEGRLYSHRGRGPESHGIYRRTHGG